MLARIFSISTLVKARSVCVRILPRMSADGNTLAAVSSFGASKTHTYLVIVAECPVHLLLIVTPIDCTFAAQSATR